MKTIHLLVVLVAAPWLGSFSPQVSAQETAPSTLRAQALRAQGEHYEAAHRALIEGRLDFAETAARASVHASPNLVSVIPRDLLVNILIRKGDYLEALMEAKVAEGIMDRNEENPSCEIRMRARVGYLKLKTGDVAGSRAAWKPEYYLRFGTTAELAAVLPNNIGTINGLETMWLTVIARESNEYFDRLFYYDRAYQKEPTNLALNYHKGVQYEYASQRMQEREPENFAAQIALCEKSLRHFLFVWRNAPSGHARKSPMGYYKNASGEGARIVEIRLRRLLKARDGG